MSIDHLILGYLIVVLAGMAALIIYAELRQRRFTPAPSEDRVFRCKNCGYVYTDDPDVDRSRCTQCGKMNEAVEF
jgi:rubrerythrin